MPSDSSASRPAIRHVAFAGAIGLPQQDPPDELPQVAMAGRSNCGKSSLINAVVGRKSLARVSQTPGKTREINFYLVNDSFFLVDLPGYGYARAPGDTRDLWPTLIDPYLADNERLRGVVVLLDCRRGVLPIDRRLLSHWSDCATAMPKPGGLIENEEQREAKFKEMADYFINLWLELKKEDRTIASLYDYWILGKNAVPTPPRWSVVRNVLHWVK